MSGIVRSLLELNLPGTTTVYHVTKSENIPSIQLHGLEPRLGQNSLDVGDTEEAIYVFLSWATLEDAVMNWEMMDWASEYDEPDLAALVLEVPRKWIRDDPNMLASVGLIYQRIPPEMIKTVIEDI